MEHLQISTAFQDTYKFFFTKGQHTVTLVFTDLNDIIDIHKNGLRFFTYCANPFSLLTSALSSSFMWIGGSGTSKYIPFFGYKPSNYQADANSEFVENFTGQSLEKRIINKVDIDLSVFKTGDILVARRFVGWSSLFMILQGGLANHVAIVVDEGDGNKMVYECMTETWWSDSGASVQKTDL